MNERTVATGLFVLPFLYVDALVLTLFRASDVGVFIGLATCLAIALLLGLGGIRGQLIAVTLDVALAFLVGAALLGSAFFGGLASQLTVGVLLGIPFLVSALAWREGAGLAHRTAALAVAIVMGTALLAARDTVTAVPPANTATGFVQAFFSVNLTQVQGLATIATGGVEPGLPLRAAFDPTFAALCALAAGGVLLLVLRPRSGTEERLPLAATLGSSGARGQTDRLVMFSEAQRRTFEARSRTEPPTGAWPPGLEAVACAALATTAFLGIAFATPVFAPLLLAAGVTAVLASVALTSARSPAVSRRP